MPLIAIDGSDFVTFVTGSIGGNNAICNLLHVYGHRMHDGLLPIIALKTTSYKSKKYGRIEGPDFPIVGWHGQADERQQRRQSYYRNWRRHFRDGRLRTVLTESSIAGRRATTARKLLYGQ